MTLPLIPLVIAAAIARNGAIGRDNRLPWSMPGDLAHFRAITMGKPMIMGRLTFESIGRVLPGRESIVVTRAGRAGPAPGLFHAESPEEAVALGQERAAAMGADEIMLVGGAQLFTALMPQVRRLRLTLIDLEPEADIFFPAIDSAVWREAAYEDFFEEGPPEPRLEAVQSLLEFLEVGRATERELVAMRTVLNPAVTGFQNAESYGKIPNIDEVERALGCAATGFVFDR